MAVGLGLSIGLILVEAWWSSRPIDALQDTFRGHRQEFASIAASALESYRKTCEYQFPTSPLYHSAHIEDRDNVCFDQIQAHSTIIREPTKIWIEFIEDDFYLPIVYIESDEPLDVYDTCSEGGVPVEKLEQNWYICKRDWN